MSDPGPRLARWRLIERLVELAAPAEKQVAFISRSGSDNMGQRIWDLAADFWEWTSGLPAMVEDGVVPPDLAQTILRVVDDVRAIRDADDLAWTQRQSNWFHSPDGLASEPLWGEVRLLAQEALAGFSDLGIPIPSLDDPDFDAPRQDAP
jgi:hypothetical protein